MQPVCTQCQSMMEGQRQSVGLIRSKEGDNIVIFDTNILPPFNLK